jgi:hypothetical protein
MADPEQQTHLDVDVPNDLRGGVYADAAMVWHSEHGFTIDFLAPVAPTQEVDGVARQAATVVARVRLPVGVIFQLARAISDNVANYEQTFGEIGSGGPAHPEAP